MSVQLVPLARFEFVVEVAWPIALFPSGRAARKVADTVAADMRRAIVEATVQGVLPGYVIQVTVGQVRRGSLVIELLLNAEVWIGAAAATALHQLVKEYPKLREGLLAIAKDVAKIPRAAARGERRIRAWALGTTYVSTDDEFQQLARDVEAQVKQQEDAKASAEAGRVARAEARAAMAREHASQASRDRRMPWR